MNPEDIDARRISRTVSLDMAVNAEEFDARGVSRTHSLDSSSVKEVDPAALFQQAYSDDDFQIRTPRRSKEQKGKEGISEDITEDGSELEDLLNDGKEELLRTTVLALRHLSSERIVPLMNLILDVGGDCPEGIDNSRPLPKVSKSTVRGLKIWSKLVSRVKTFASIRFTSPSAHFITWMFSVRKPRSIRGAAMQMSDAVAEVLEGRYLPDLQHLALPPCHISTIVRALINGRVSTLQRLELQGHSGRSPFTNSRPLRRLFMSGLLDELQHLGLSRCMEEEEMEGLAAALNSGTMRSLRHLDLSFNHFQGPDGSRALVTLMRCKALIGLEHLNLKECHISDEGMKGFASAIMARGPWKLKYLNLQSNDIGDSGFASLLKLVKSNKVPHLQELHLLYNYGIGEESKIQAAKLLENGHVSQLQVVYLSSHILTERVAEAFLAAYKNNTGLFVELRNVLWPNELIERGVARYRERNLGLLFSARKAAQLQQQVPDKKG
ncbi:unnamed protein product [Calypogeia fissa]